MRKRSCPGTSTRSTGSLRAGSPGKAGTIDAAGGGVEVGCGAEAGEEGGGVAGPEGWGVVGVVVGVLGEGGV